MKAPVILLAQMQGKIQGAMARVDDASARVSVFHRIVEDVATGVSPPLSAQAVADLAALLGSEATNLDRLLRQLGELYVASRELASRLVLPSEPPPRRVVAEERRDGA